MHVLWRREKLDVDAEPVAGETHHDVPVAREPQRLDLLQAEGPQPLEQLRLVSRGWALEPEIELRAVAAPLKKASQRLKHLVGPGTNARSELDHTSVEISICSGESRILFTEDGRPPRMRLETVPAVEMTVPLVVCSM